jgi:hypothetical protein
MNLLLDAMKIGPAVVAHPGLIEFNIRIGGVHDAACAHLVGPAYIRSGSSLDVSH